MLELSKETMDLNEWRDRAYRNALWHGFHKNPTTLDTYMMLIITELSEAVEADRKNRHADNEGFKSDSLNRCKSFDNSFRNNIKDTVEDELADTFIRLLDFAGAENLNLSKVHIYQFDVNEADTFADNCYHLVMLLQPRDTNLEPLIKCVLANLFKLSEIVGFDLMYYVDLKMKYNANREYMHEKKILKGMEKEKTIDAIRKAAQEYACENVQGVSIFSAFIAMIRQRNFEAGAVWRLNNKSGKIEDAAKECAKEEFKTDNASAKKRFIGCFARGAKWVDKNIKD